MKICSLCLSSASLVFFLRRFDWSRPAFLIGFVLSEPIERFTNQAFQIASFRFRDSFEAGMSYVFSPIVIVLVILTVVSVVFGIRQSKNIIPEGDTASGSKRAPMIFLLLVLSYFVFSLLNAHMIPDYNMTDKIIPLVIGGFSLICCLVLLIQMMLRSEGNALFADKEIAGEDAQSPYGLWSSLSWFAGLILATFFFGFIIALLGFLLTFFRIRAQQSWIKASILTAAGIALMLVLAGALNRDFPPGLLQDFVDLPWPLG